MSIVKEQPKSIIRKRTVKTRFSEMPVFEKVKVTTDKISFFLSDKRIIIVPLSFVPKLLNATGKERSNHVIRGHFVFWESLDEIIGVKNLLNGTIVPK